LLETSFCGSKPTLADNLIEPSKPETDDLEKILLKREADTTKALIPESIKVPMVGGNLKPDPLDKPRRRGREERMEIFKREVEITKRFLEKANIRVGLAARQILIFCFLNRSIFYRELSSQFARHLDIGISLNISYLESQVSSLDSRSLSESCRYYRGSE